MQDYTERLGTVMSQENIAELERLVSEQSLPILPQDPSIHEIDILLTYHGNRMAYLMANHELVNGRIQTQKMVVTDTYNAAFAAAYARNSDASATVLKSVASGNKEYLAARKELQELMDVGAKLQSEISALQEQNVCLRKIASMQALAMQRGLE